VSSGFALDALRIGFAILLDAAALVIWDIGTRSPVPLLADVRAGRCERRSIVRGTLRVVSGALLFTAGVAVSAPVATHRIDLSVIECWALATGLVIEQLVGPDFRRSRH